MRRRKRSRRVRINADGLEAWRARTAAGVAVAGEDLLDLWGRGRSTEQMREDVAAMAELQLHGD